MADYSINAVTRRVVYTGSAGVGPYAFSFEVLAATDIAVYKNSTKLTLTTNYTVTINANGTGSVTLTSAATGSDTITIIGSRAIERTTDFVTAGDLLAASLNEQLDSQIVMIQQLAEENKRTLRAPPYDPAATEDGGTLNMALPPKATRAGKVLAFNSSTGNPEMGPSLAEVANVESNANAAAASAASASASASSATASASSATASASSAATNASSASASASTATSAASSASSSASSATASASTATTKADEASASAALANDWATKTTGTVAGGEYSAKYHAQAAATSASTASSAASSASSAQTAAEAARDATLASFDSFDDRYLGAKASDPATDNDGNPLVAGALYFDTTVGGMKVYTGSAWVAAYISGSGYLAAANNLSDLQSAATARTNLGLGSISTLSAPSGTVVGTTDSQTLTNKTISGSSNTITNVSLTSGVTGTLPAANGGTGITSPGTAGNILTSNGTSWVSQAPAASAGVPTGGIIYYPSTSAPSGYLKCDGTIYNRSSYSALSTVIGSPMLPSSETLRNSSLAMAANTLTAGQYIASVNNTVFMNGSANITSTSTANALRTSTDGITFTLRTAAAPYIREGVVTYFASTYVMLTRMAPALGATVNYQTSTDLATWTQRTFTAGTNAGTTLALAGNQTWGRGIMHTATTFDNGCDYVFTNPYYWYYSTNGTTWTAASSPPTNTLYFDPHCVQAGTSSALALYAPSATTWQLWYTADGNTWSNVTSNITSTFPSITNIYKIFWTGTYFYALCNLGIVLRSTTGASGAWSQTSSTQGLGAITSTNPFSQLYDQYRTYSTDGTYHIIQAGNAGQFWYSSDLVNWGYVSGLSGYYGAVSGSNFVGRSFTGSTTNTYTLTGTGYTTATQFPVPNLLSATASAFGTFAPAPIPYIKT